MICSWRSRPVAIAGWRGPAPACIHQVRSGVTNEIVHQIEMLGHVRRGRCRACGHGADSGRGGRVLVWLVIQTCRRRTVMEPAPRRTGSAAKP